MEFEEFLRKMGLKVTNQRLAIMRVLGSSGTMTAMEIFEKVKEILPGVNFSTIYRNVEIMKKRGILCTVVRSDGIPTYLLRIEEAHHHHFICKRCGKSLVIEYCPMNFMGEEVKKKGFVPVEHEFVVYGFCRDCDTSDFEDKKERFLR
ncbi:Fur family transcriptional regulator, zinc uptake regulator [Caldanaerovirga acetigignens]|uniref:Fur family transcriptional regulator, zinc uptake regulator n=1 Tax=Caldanaerovirga acetigignens TaxID=447595 RepID=A0A1M7GY07_9FIRM|nr:Fur family transcriptional regulator [Caldanaerovirga acetigignens]SHM20729.1 Fur family transcriptional regulator, zinc uptake regulator [Caldanaerovirga acetigignens]